MLEFRSRGVHSGVFLRSGKLKDVLAALEIQVHEKSRRCALRHGRRHLHAQPPSKNMAKPVGEWNRFHDHCNDSHVSLISTPRKCGNVGPHDWKEPKKNPDGTPNKFAKELKDFSRNAARPAGTPRQGPGSRLVSNIRIKGELK